MASVSITGRCVQSGATTPVDVRRDEVCDATDAEWSELTQPVFAWDATLDASNVNPAQDPLCKWHCSPIENLAPINVKSNQQPIVA